MQNEFREIFRLAARYFYKKYKATGGSQKKLAEQLGITQSYLSSVINGSRSASLEMHCKIANTLYGPYDKFLKAGRRIKNGLDPEEQSRPAPDGNVETLLARITHYVIDHKRIEHELKDTRNFYEQIVEGILTGVFVTNARDEIYFINTFMVEHVGVPKEEIIGTNIITAGEKFKKSRFKHIEQHYMLTRKNLKPHYFENVPVTTPAGQPVFQTGWMIPQIVDGQYNGMIVTITDTTKSQELAKLLTLSLENSVNAIGVVKQQQPDGRIEAYFMNKKMRLLFGLEGLHPEKIPFKKVHARTAEHIVNRKEWERFALDNLKSGRPEGEFIIEHTNGKRYDWRSKALTDENSIYCGRMVTVEEKTEERFQVVEGPRFRG